MTTFQMALPKCGWLASALKTRTRWPTAWYGDRTAGFMVCKAARPRAASLVRDWIQRTRLELTLRAAWYGDIIRKRAPLRSSPRAAATRLAWRWMRKAGFTPGITGAALEAGISYRVGSIKCKG